MDWLAVVFYGVIGVSLTTSGLATWFLLRNRH
jgi:hypothetical protein